MINPKLKNNDYVIINIDDSLPTAIKSIADENPFKIYKFKHYDFNKCIVEGLDYVTLYEFMLTKVKSENLCLKLHRFVGSIIYSIIDGYSEIVEVTETTITLKPVKSNQNITRTYHMTGRLIETHPDAGECLLWPNSKLRSWQDFNSVNFHPKDEEYYYYIDVDRSLVRKENFNQSSYHEADRRYLHNNMFETEELANEALVQIKQILYKAPKCLKDVDNENVLGCNKYNL